MEKQKKMGDLRLLKLCFTCGEDITPIKEYVKSQQTLYLDNKYLEVAVYEKNYNLIEFILHDTSFRDINVMAVFSFLFEDIDIKMLKQFAKWNPFRIFTCRTAENLLVHALTNENLEMADYLFSNGVILGGTGKLLDNCYYAERTKRSSIEMLIHQGEINVFMEDRYGDDYHEDVKTQLENHFKNLNDYVKPSIRERNKDEIFQQLYKTLPSHLKRYLAFPLLKYAKLGHTHIIKSAMESGFSVPNRLKFPLAWDVNNHDAEWLLSVFKFPKWFLQEFNYESFIKHFNKIAMCICLVKLPSCILSHICTFVSPLLKMMVTKLLKL